MFLPQEGTARQLAIGGDVKSLVGRAVNNLPFSHEYMMGPRNTGFSALKKFLD
jgi:hypothetical protein